MLTFDKVARPIHADIVLLKRSFWYKISGRGLDLQILVGNGHLRVSEVEFARSSSYDCNVSCVNLLVYLMEVSKAGIEILDTFLEASERVKALSDPPAGPFDKNCTALDWKHRNCGGKQYLSTFIPTNTFKDFCNGEEGRASCSFYVQKTGQKKKEDKRDALADH